MSKLSVDQKNIGLLFSDKKSDFIIPDYQRPYAWTETECLTLWDDIFDFAFPDKDKDKFNNDEEYYLGPIVTFKNDDGKLEVIDGQQRLTTLMLLLRAFYVKLQNAQDSQTVKTRENIEKCLWKTDEFGTANMNELKINSEVATDNDKEEFLYILKTGIADSNLKSKYAVNYRFFQNKINEFVDNYAMFFAYFPTRILNNCILLPIEADNQNTALRIFSTLNDRGMPLSDADIFKAQFYKYYTAKNERKQFIEKWKSLEDICEEIFHPQVGTPMDEIFTRYMYYERAKLGIKTSTTESLRKFYEKNSYSLLNNDITLQNLIYLANFWHDIYKQDKKFSDEVLKKLFVLNYAPNGMWCYFLSVYYMQNKDSNNNLDNEKLNIFLTKSIAFIWAYAITNPGVNALRTPIFSEMINIVNNNEVTFKDYSFNEDSLRTTLVNYDFFNQRPITKSMLTWWAFQNQNQQLIELNSDNILEIEHIFAKNRQEIEKITVNQKNIESLGNKAILEKHINIRASDYRFKDKKEFYLGFTTSKGEYKEKTKNNELLELANAKNDFVESDIESRNSLIINSFIEHLKNNSLIK